jgi:hypothetical protein
MASFSAPQPNSDVLWGHMRRASSFGAPPLSRDRPSPWLLTGRPTDPEVTPRGGVHRASAPPPAHAATQASLYRHRAAQNRRDGPAVPARQVTGRSGPCEERHQPLSRHAPRRLVTRAERQRPPKWQPTREWRAWPTLPGDTTPKDAELSGMPLRGFSQAVVEHCAHVYAGSSDRDFFPVRYRLSELGPPLWLVALDARLVCSIRRTRSLARRAA